MTDEDRLRACLESEALPGTAGDAFQDMLIRMEAGRLRVLSPGQKQWLNDMCAVCGVEAGEDPGAENLVSSGKVKVKPGEREALKEMLNSLGPKVLVPPHRRKGAG